MKCMYCKQPVGFMKTYHEECKSKIKSTVEEMMEVLIAKEDGEISAKESRIRLSEISLSNELYHNYMKSKVIAEQDIHMNEVIIYADGHFRIMESKNRCKMVETGYRYEKMPTWSEKNFKLDEYGHIALTDQAVYMYVGGKTMRYPYNKIVNCGYEELWSMKHTFFDIKTSSPYPHRFSLVDSDNDKKRKKEERIYFFLRGLI